LNSFRKI